MLVHEHLLVRAWVMEPIKSFPEADAWLDELIHIIRMRPVAPATGAYVETPGNRGVTIVRPIETSHLAMHVWDEMFPALVELDVFSCSEFHPAEILAHMKSMRPVATEAKFLDRANGFKDMPAARWT